MAFKLPVPIPTPFGIAFKPPSKPTAYVPPAQSENTGSLSSYVSSGSGGYRAPATAVAGEMKNRKYLSPWDEALQSQYNKANAPGSYAGDWRNAVTQARGLTGKDFTGDLNRLGQEQVAQQQAQQTNQFGALGMRELSTRADIQADWTKQRTDTSTKAAIDAQGMQVQALDALRTMLSGASGAELDRIQAAISAASSGAGNYNDVTRLNLAIEDRKRAEEEKKKAAAKTAATTPPRSSDVWYENSKTFPGIM